MVRVEGDREEWTLLDVRLHYKALLIKTRGTDSQTYKPVDILDSGMYGNLAHDKGTSHK